MKPTSDLLIVAPADRPLTPAQRKFNQLLVRIEQARAELLAWQQQRAAFATVYSERTRPLRADIAGCRLAIATRLDALAGLGKWSKADRRTLGEVVCEVVSDLMEEEQTTEAEAARLKALYDKHADVDFDTEARKSVAVMKDMFEAMSGLDLGDEAFDSEEDLLRRTRERVGAEREARQQRAEQAPQKPARKKTAAQRRREAEEKEASQSVREVYRKLASALHPDRADDEADRVSRTALMQRVNRAYEAKDLLALFALQLEIEQVDAAHLARATAERAAHYNQLLSAQLADLNAELESCELGFIMDFGQDMGIGPNDRVRPGQLGKLLDRHVAELNAMLAQARQDLRQIQEPVGAKRWLKRVRQQQAVEDDLYF
jgi:hypothetical protein